METFVVRIWTPEKGAGAEEPPRLHGTVERVGTVSRRCSVTTASCSGFSGGTSHLHSGAGTTAPRRASDAVLTLAGTIGAIVSPRRGEEAMRKAIPIGLGLIAAFVVALRAAAAPPPFALSPRHLTITAAVGSPGYAPATVTNTSGAPLVVENPAQATAKRSGSFFDTQTGSCWQAYEALGNPIPEGASCTIQVGFVSSSAGKFAGTLTVRQCTAWSTDPTFGFIVCSSLGYEKSIPLSGVAS